MTPIYLSALCNCYWSACTFRVCFLLQNGTTQKVQSYYAVSYDKYIYADYLCPLFDVFQHPYLEFEVLLLKIKPQAYRCQ